MKELLVTSSNGLIGSEVVTYFDQSRQSLFGASKIHAHDVARCIELFYEMPQSGAVFNLSGGRENSVSMLKAFDRAEQLAGKAMKYRYIDEPRLGDHICYISDLSHLKPSLPGWNISRSLVRVFEEIVESWHERQLNPITVG